MWRMLVERSVSLLVLAALVGSAAVGGVFVGSVVGGYSVSAAGLLRSFVDIVLLAFAIGGVGIFAVTMLRSAVATGLTGALLVACFFLTTVAGLLGWPGWTTSPSVFDAFGTPYLTLPSAGSLIYLLVLGGGGVLASYYAMRRGLRVAD